MFPSVGQHFHPFTSNDDDHDYDENDEAMTTTMKHQSDDDTYDEQADAYDDDEDGVDNGVFMMISSC